MPCLTAAISRIVTIDNIKHAQELECVCRCKNKQIQKISLDKRETVDPIQISLLDQPYFTVLHKASRYFDVRGTSSFIPLSSTRVSRIDHAVIDNDMKSTEIAGCEIYC